MNQFNTISSESGCSDAMVQHNQSIEISIVIPVYNSADTLQTLFSRLVSSLDQIGRPYEIVFVEDGSNDSSWEILQTLHSDHPDKVHAVQLMRNYGQHNALMCGLRNSAGKYIVTMDDDLQNPPEEIRKLLSAIEETDSDCVYGTYHNKEHANWRNFGSHLLLAFYKLIFKSSISPTSFRIIRRQVVESILNYSLNFTYVDGLLAWNTQRVSSIAVIHAPRNHGESGYTFRKLLLLALNLFTNFSLLPLQVVSILGFMLATIGFATGLYYVVQHFLTNLSVPGFASLIVAILVLGGAQMMALGIVGEYLGRLHLNVNQKPQYHEREILMRKGKRNKEPPPA